MKDEISKNVENYSETFILQMDRIGCNIIKRIESVFDEKYMTDTEESDFIRLY